MLRIVYEAYTLAQFITLNILGVHWGVKKNEKKIFTQSYSIMLEYVCKIQNASSN